MAMGVGRELNYRSGFLWQLMQRCPSIVTGLRRAGFTVAGLSAAS
jgi:hypothetical protein